MQRKKISLIKETKKLLLYGSLLIFTLSWILSIILLDLGILANLIFGLVISLIITITCIVSFYFIGMLLFLKLALFFGKISKNKTIAYITIFAPMILFLFARLFDFNTFFAKMMQDTQSIVLFSSLIILDIVFPIINYFILTKIIKKYRINFAP